MASLVVHMTLFSVARGHQELLMFTQPCVDLASCSWAMNAVVEEEAAPAREAEPPGTCPRTPTLTEVKAALITIPGAYEEVERVKYDCHQNAQHLSIENNAASVSVATLTPADHNTVAVKFIDTSVAAADGLAAMALATVTLDASRLLRVAPQIAKTEELQLESRVVAEVWGHERPYSTIRGVIKTMTKGRGRGSRFSQPATSSADI